MVVMYVDLETTANNDRSAEMRRQKRATPHMLLFDLFSVLFLLLPFKHTRSLADTTTSPSG
jgi:hypothetical protein